LCTGEKQHFYFYDLTGGTVQKVTKRDGETETATDRDRDRGRRSRETERKDKTDTRFVFLILSFSLSQVLNIRGVQRDETLERVVLSQDGQQIAVLGDFGNIHLLHGKTKQL
jgi:hypothetical protein